MRAATLQEKLCPEDYLALIAELVDRKGYAMVVEIAEGLGVRSASVTGMIRRLALKGWVRHQPRRYVRLTEAGRAVATDLRRRRGILVDFFRSLGIPAERAQREIHALEHVVSPGVLRVLAKRTAR